MKFNMKGRKIWVNFVINFSTLNPSSSIQIYTSLPFYGCFSPPKSFHRFACDGTSRVLMDDDKAQSLDKLLSSHLGGVGERSKTTGGMYIVRTTS